MSHTERSQDKVAKHRISIEPLAQGVEDSKTFEVRGFMSGIVNAGGTGLFLFETGDKIVRVYTRKITVNGDEVEYKVTAGVTATHGDEVTPVNRNTGGPASDVTVSTAPTGVSGGSDLQPVYLPGAAGQGQTNQGQFEVNTVPRVLLPNLKYLATITNNGAKALMNAEVLLQWTEYDD